MQSFYGFHGTRSVEEVAEILQKRVRLYLEERKQGLFPKKLSQYILTKMHHIWYICRRKERLEKAISCIANVF